MIQTGNDAIGIIFPNNFDDKVPELVSERMMASIPFASRYRMIDFVLSTMAKSGIEDISILMRRNYFSLMDHVSSGREWDLSRKNGGLRLVPPYAQKAVSTYTGRIDALESIIQYLKKQKCPYVVMADANIALNFDFKDFIRAHKESGAVCTAAYVDEFIGEDFEKNTNITTESPFYSLIIDDKNRVTDIYINHMEKNKVNKVGINIYVINREYLIEQVEDAYMRGKLYFERDLLIPQLAAVNVHAYKYEGYFARITSLKSYFDENMRLLEDENLDALFGPSPIYTKIRDDNPTRYMPNALVKNVMAADGCIIEGEVENCVLFRGVKIGRGAVVKNCVLMQDTVVEPGARLDYVVSDKNATISERKELHGAPSFPVFVHKNQTV